MLPQSLAYNSKQHVFGRINKDGDELVSDVPKSHSCDKPHQQHFSDLVTGSSSSDILNSSFKEAGNANKLSTASCPQDAQFQPAAKLPYVLFLSLLEVCQVVRSCPRQYLRFRSILTLKRHLAAAGPSLRTSFSPPPTLFCPSVLKGRKVVICVPIVVLVSTLMPRLPYVFVFRVLVQKYALKRKLCALLCFMDQKRAFLA